MVTFWSLGHASLVCQVLSPDATLVFEVQGGKKASREGEEDEGEDYRAEGELDDSRTSMPALVRPWPFIFIYRPLGPIYFNIWGIFTIVGVWMIITYHHAKPEPVGCLGCWEKAGPLYFNIGPWGPLSSNYGAYLPLLVCGWSIPITIPNQSQVAALVAKKK